MSDSIIDKIKKYNPTEEENSIIKKANGVFLAYYLTGVTLGVFAGKYVIRNRASIFPERFSAVPSWLLFIPTALVGEITGRQLGSFQAKSILQSLPTDSKLRQAMRKDLGVFTSTEDKGYKAFGGDTDGKSEDVWGTNGGSEGNMDKDHAMQEFSSKQSDKSTSTNGYGDSME